MTRRRRKAGLALAGDVEASVPRRAVRVVWVEFQDYVAALRGATRFRLRGGITAQSGSRSARRATVGDQVARIGPDRAKFRLNFEAVLELPVDRQISSEVNDNRRHFRAAFHHASNQSEEDVACCAETDIDEALKAKASTSNRAIQRNMSVSVLLAFLTRP